MTEDTPQVSIYDIQPLPSFGLVLSTWEWVLVIAVLAGLCWAVWYFSYAAQQRKRAGSIAAVLDELRQLIELALADFTFGAAGTDAEKAVMKDSNALRTKTSQIALLTKRLLFAVQLLPSPTVTARQLRALALQDRSSNDAKGDTAKLLELLLALEQIRFSPVLEKNLSIEVLKELNSRLATVALSVSKTSVEKVNAEHAKDSDTGSTTTIVSGAS